MVPPPVPAARYRGPTDGWFSAVAIVLIWLFCCWPVAAILLLRSGHPRGWKIFGGILAGFQILLIAAGFAVAIAGEVTYDRQDAAERSCALEARTVDTAVRAFAASNGRLPLAVDELLGSSTAPGFLEGRPRGVGVTVAPLAGGGVEVSYAWSGRCAELDPPLTLPEPLRG